MPDYDLWIVFEGSGNFYIDGMKYNLRAGKALLLFPGSYVHATHDPENPLYVIAIHFDFLNGAPDVAQKHLFFDNFHKDFVHELMWRSVNAGINQQKEEANFWLSASLKELLPEPQNTSFSFYNEKIEELCNEMIVHPERRITVSDMASHLNLCKDHFARVFKEVKGCTPQKYLIKIKIDKACYLLLNSNQTIAEIADQLGYNSVNFFCRQFKTITGTTPKQYAKSN